MSDMASEREARAASVLPANTPRTALVTVWLPGFFTPRMLMHMCSASSTTTTPCGFSCLTRVLGNLRSQTPCTCGRFAYTSTRRASFDKPHTRPSAAGM